MKHDAPLHGAKLENAAQVRLLTPEEAARWLGVGRSTLYELLAAGEIPSIRIGRCRRIPSWELRRFIEEKLVQ
jgi:excisionase family DNA binding protein